ncbi:hypothetical protein GCM10009122_58860 [Fulvivirga kasyanovii]|uniref:XRE family transcriptional regulator n=1 Tax=Fulvivirga kasyanovii TaxID=396812 RepID=A0ABW9RY93_9BACT|nr:helix-turn-helix transcriptional regulator [Fulvivirga kasyanovii]MTI27980.1 XRE family transcriptional regulator [Fulvivirga kasyanovii]
MKEKLNRLKVIMAEKEVSVAELARKVNKHEQTIIAYRNNVKQPPLKMIYQLAEALEIDPCELLVK